MVLQHELLPELPGAEVDIFALPIVGRYLLVLLNHLQGPDLFPPEVPHDPGPKNIWVAAVVDEGDVVVKTALCRVVESGVWANLDVGVGKNSQQFAPLVSSVVFPEVKIWILGAEFFNIDILTSQYFDILRGIMQVDVTKLVSESKFFFDFEFCQENSKKRQILAKRWKSSVSSS